MPTDTQFINKQIDALRANEEKALEQLYYQNYGKVEYYILQNNGSREDAKDIFQEAFTIVWRNIQLNKYEPREGSSIEAYLLRIAKYKWIDQLRQKSVKSNIPLPTELSEMIFEELEDEEVKQLNSIKDKFLQLGDNCKELLARFYYGRQPMREIARAFKWTEATAKNNKYRCVEKLKMLVKRNHE